jgi:hypothetical protein
MGRKQRDRDAERIAIAAAADRLLAGTSLRSTTGRLTATELIIESGLRRDVVYEHDKTSKIVENFSARVKARNAVPEAMYHLVGDNLRLKNEPEETRAALAQERGKIKVLLRVNSELSLELEQAREELAPLNTSPGFHRASGNSVASVVGPSGIDKQRRVESATATAAVSPSDYTMSEQSGKVAHQKLQRASPWEP